MENKASSMGRAIKELPLNLKEALQREVPDKHRDAVTQLVTHSIFGIPYADYLNGRGQTQRGWLLHKAKTFQEARRLAFDNTGLGPTDWSYLPEATYSVIRAAVDNGRSEICYLAGQFAFDSVLARFGSYKDVPRDVAIDIGANVRLSTSFFTVFDCEFKDKEEVSKFVEQINAIHNAGYALAAYVRDRGLYYLYDIKRTRRQQAQLMGGNDPASSFVPSSK